MKLRQAVATLLALILLGACAGMMNPLKDVDIPMPENPDPFYFFQRSATSVLYKQSEKLEQSRLDLENIVRQDSQFAYPEAYPLLVDCYVQLGLEDSSAWVVDKARLLLEEQEGLADSLVLEMEGYIQSYPERPERFKDRSFKIVSSMPEPIGGYRALYVNLEYPEMAKAMQRVGTSYFSFTIQADASLTDLHLLKSSYPDLDEAAAQVFKKVTWKPAIYRGRPVPYQMVFPITFQ